MSTSTSRRASGSPPRSRPRARRRSSFGSRAATGTATRTAGRCPPPGRRCIAFSTASSRTTAGDFATGSMAQRRRRRPSVRQAMPPFLVCIHDASPAFARETRAMVRDLAPLVGRRFSFGVVPDWHGAWPLDRHPAYCELLRESADELLLHGHLHRRANGRGLVSLLTGHCDEMNGLTSEVTRQTLERGQREFSDAFGVPARSFLAPGWQRGHVRLTRGNTAGLENILGFF